MGEGKSGREKGQNVRPGSGAQPGRAETDHFLSPRVRTCRTRTNPSMLRYDIQIFPK